MSAPMPDHGEERLQRRSLLRTDGNPESATDYLVSLTGTVNRTGATVRLFYVPDKFILLPEAFNAYLTTLDALDWPNLESLALAVIDDINNEVVPKWVQITAQKAGETTARDHMVLVEDRQPNWDNPALLDRLRQW